MRTWRTCQTHGDEQENVYGCAECVRELRAENRQLRMLLTDVAYQLTKARIWDGQRWAYNPLAPLFYKPVLKKVEALLHIINREPLR